MAEPRIVWNAEMFLKRANAVAEEVAKDAADMVLKDAKRILMRKAKHPTGRLASQIEIVKSKDKGGGYHVVAQAPGKYDDYYAVFVELGTPNKKGRRRGSVKKMPYLRPALQKNKRKMLRMFKAAIKG